MLVERLKRARNSANLSLRRLGKLMGLSHSTILNYEKGITVPNSDYLLQLTKVLNLRSEYFFREESILKLEKIHYKFQDDSIYISSSKLQAIEIKSMDILNQRLLLENYYPEKVTTTFDVSKVNNSLKVTNSTDYYEFEYINQYSKELRKLWSLGSYAISNISLLLEEKGIKVIRVNTITDFDVFTALAYDNPVIVINSNLPIYTQRYMIAYMLGAILLRDKTNLLYPKRAYNDFARSFLLPDLAIKNILGCSRSNLELLELNYIKSIYGLPIESIIFRANQLGIISRKNTVNLWKSLHTKHNNSNDNFNHEFGYFNSLVYKALSLNYISEAKAAEFLGISTKKFHDYRIEGILDE